MAVKPTIINTMSHWRPPYTLNTITVTFQSSYFCLPFTLAKASFLIQNNVQTKIQNWQLRLYQQICSRPLFSRSVAKSPQQRKPLVAVVPLHRLEMPRQGNSTTGSHPVSTMKGGVHLKPNREIGKIKDIFSFSRSTMFGSIQIQET